MALHINTKQDKANTEAIEARIASGQMASAQPAADFVARTPVPPFLADNTLQPAEAPKSAFPVASLRADQCHTGARAVRPACLVDTPKYSNEVVIAAWLRYLLAVAVSQALASSKSHWLEMKRIEARWHARNGEMPPEIPKRAVVPSKPPKREAVTPDAMEAAA